MERFGILIFLLGLSIITCAPVDKEADEADRKACSDANRGCPDYEPAYGNYTKNVDYLDDPRFFYACMYEYYDGESYVTVGNECQICVAKLVFSYECQECTSQYKRDNKSCSPATEAPVIRPYVDLCELRNLDDSLCEDKELNTMYRDDFSEPGNYSNYYFCQNGTEPDSKKIVGCNTCPDYLIVNEKCQRCDKYDNRTVYKTDDQANCTIGITGDHGQCDDHERCMAKEDGDFELTEDSTNYYSCSNGYCYNRTCPANLVYSKRCEACTYEYDECEVKLNYTAAEERAIEYCPDNFCDERNMGNYPADEANKYYQCIGFGIGVAGKKVKCLVNYCPNGFDEKVRICIDYQSPYYNSTVERYYREYGITV